MTSISSKEHQSRVAIDLGITALAHSPTPNTSSVRYLPIFRKTFTELRTHQSEIIKCLRPCLPRKEVIQPHLPLRLPCYDFVPINNHTFGTCLLAVSPATSGTIIFRDVTGGVYKARERIHRSVADLRLLVIPASCRRVAACNPN